MMVRLYKYINMLPDDWDLLHGSSFINSIEPFFVYFGGECERFSGGCFVTNVSPDGSAARSRGVEIGDQLASINGTNSLKMKVDDICDAISDSSDSSKIELIFL